MRTFAQVADAVTATSKKTEKIRLLSAYLRSLPVGDAALAALFLTGRPFPRWDERVLGVGGALLSKLVISLAGDDEGGLGRAYRKHGDLGDVAEELLRDRGAAGADAHPAALPAAVSVTGISLQELAAAFEAVAALRASREKADVLKRLFKKATPGEVKYAVKIITGELRMGSKEALVEEAIAQAYGRPLDAVRRANMLLGDIGETLQRAFRDELAGVAFRLFHPIDFMLAMPVETSAELFEAGGGGVFAEEKYDGIRAQAHKSASRVKLFSRTLDEIVEFSELTKPLLELPGEFIVDGEILGWRDENPLPFTQLQKRLGRKQPSLWLGEEIPVVFVIFDLLYLDGELLIDLPLRERRKRLEQMPLPASPRLRVAGQSYCQSAEEVDRVFRAALGAGHEGIVAKAPESLYTPGRRGGSWRKWKEPLGTLDVVVTAVEYGHGRRRNVLSDYTFAVRDGDRLLNIGKAYSGLTDAEIREYTDYFVNHTIENQGARRLVEPVVVLEVAFNNVQRSNRHDSGFALRFPRIVRLRADKSAREIDTLDRVRAVYEKQASLRGNVVASGAADETKG